MLEAFFAWAEATVAKLSAKSALAEAFRYTIKRREALSRFVTDGRLEVDNNIAENAMRVIALGRNYAHLRIMRRCRATCADSPVDRAVLDALLATNCT